LKNKISTTRNCRLSSFADLPQAMRKDFFSGFSIFAKDETVFFPYSNLTWNKFDIFVFAVISQNKYGTKYGTQILNDYKNNRI